MPLIKNQNLNYEDEPFMIPEIKTFKSISIVPENDFEAEIATVCHEIAETLIRKNRDYDDSVAESYKEFGETSVAVRLTDKLKRYKNLIKKENLVKEETIEDTILDLAGYSILRLVLKRMEK